MRFIGQPFRLVQLPPIRITKLIWTGRDSFMSGLRTEWRIYKEFNWLLNRWRWERTINHALPVPDIRLISIQIRYYTNVWTLCGSYNRFYCISFAKYHIESVLLSFYVVLWNDLLLNHAILFDVFIFLEACATFEVIGQMLAQNSIDSWLL